MIKNAPALTKIKPMKFVDFEGRSQTPAATLANTNIALQYLPLKFSLDTFRDRRTVGGVALTTDASGQVTDEAITAVREMIRQKCGFDPGKNNAWDAVHYTCRLNSFHPVKDYLENLPQWDGVKRIDTFFVKYMEAPDTDFIRGVSRIVLLASVRRIYSPGCKFDYMTVLESPEGYNKSTAIERLYGAEFFSDQSILNVSDKELQEAVRGRWAIECAELSGMKKGDVDRIKAQLTRVEDRARPAYGRAVLDVMRSCVFFGTTNETHYLRSQTGNRRFFPVPVGRIDIGAITRDRDQIWAEAMAEEPLAESIMLPKTLWEAAGAEQDERTLTDPWLDTLLHVSDAGRMHAKNNPNAEYQVTQAEERVASRFLFDSVLGLASATLSAESGKRLAMAMNKLGWQGPKPIRIGARVVKGYSRPLQVENDPWE
jgi:predicted P-loop ATPase